MKDLSMTSVPDAATLDTLPYRDAIDRVATLRAQVIRVSLDVSLLNTYGTKDEGLKAELIRLSETIQQTARVVEGQDVFTDLPNELSGWIAAQSAQSRSERRTISTMAEKTQALCEQACSGEPVSAEALNRYIQNGKGEFFEAVTAIINGLWQGIEEGRASQLAIAATSARNLEASLDRLDRIGRYVRSMSINASVEASRAGEAGKGLTIIAHEFKTLAEEVQQLIVTARTDIKEIGVE
ncbi:methyl-accepting chemotaxis protein [uncultured Roseobacter sp.]|uniref:methyl-accepting chemotaxis protein n=1 Tax=uncultured Roseobacter sp. TaxID=114847 RepID=UPI002606FE5A|nr:methyl-accepting chemotaxis protein [uncultured Roseobacter sp.]